METARNSVLSQGSVSGRSSVIHGTREHDGFSDESHAPILHYHYPSKSSNLRQTIPDNRDDASSVGPIP